MEYQTITWAVENGVGILTLNRPDAASAAAVAAEKAPHANPSHARRVSNGDVSSASTAATEAAGAEARAAAPPGEAAEVVLPVRSGVAPGAR